MSITESYNPETRWGRAFGVFDPVNYSPPDYRHRGQDIRKQNATGTASVVTEVESLSAGRISHQYTARSTGREIVVDTGRKLGRYEIHCHSAYFSKIGTELTAGQAFTRNAGVDEQPGTGWGGPHDHLVISDYPDAAHVPSRPVYDPRPFIRNALASTASGGDARPFPVPSTPPEEAAEMRVIKLTKNGATTYALVGTRFFQSTVDVEQANAWSQTWGDSRTVTQRGWDEAFNAAKL